MSFRITADRTQASLTVCSGVMVVKLVVPDPRDRALELRTRLHPDARRSSADVASPTD